jgi:hypothetical protein
MIMPALGTVIAGYLWKTFTKALILGVSNSSTIEMSQETKQK